MKLRHVLFAALLGLASTALFAANPAPAGGTGAAPGKMGHGGWCQANASDCSALAGKFDQWCSANADKCQAIKAGIERRREFCENNKGECKEQREQAMKDMKEWCSSHADKPRCKAMSQKGGDDEDDSPPAG